MNELAIPPIAKADKQAAEMVRAWVANQNLHCSLNVGVFGDQEQIMWGILLSDIARHIADAIHRSDGTEPSKTLSAIRAVFNKEIDSPSAETSGDFQ